MPRSENRAPLADTLPNRVAMQVDVHTRSDLRCRIAETIERLAQDADIAPGTRLPSTRTFANVLGVHRNTVRAALELLVERGVVEPAANGRYRISEPEPAAQPPAARGENVAALLGRAAELSIQHGETEADFTAIARTAYRMALGERRTRVYFVAPREPVPGIGAEDLAALLDYPVTTISLEDVQPAPQKIFVATTADAAAARERLNGQADVFTVGLALDADLRLAVTPLDPGSRVAVIGQDRAMLATVEGRLRRIRADVEVDGHIAPAEVADDVRLVLAPIGLALPSYPMPVARYRCTITPPELRLISARIGKDAAPAVGAARSAVA